MKRLYILLVACMGAVSVMAQGQKLKNRIIDKDYYPVNNAKVSIKGTNISTITDKNGNFVLQDVPLILDSIQVKKGQKEYAAGIPVNIKMRKAVMDRFSWFVKAGYEFPMYNFDGFDICEGSHAFFAGVGIDLKISRHWAFQPGMNLMVRKMNGYGEYDLEDRYSYGDHTYRAGVLEIPLLLALKYPVGLSANLVIKFGTYLDVGLWGKVDYTPEYGNDDRYSSMELDVYGNRFGGGAAYGVGLEFRHFMIGAIGHTGYVPNKLSDGCGYTSFGLEVGYKF